MAPLPMAVFSHTPYFLSNEAVAWLPARLRVSPPSSLLPSSLRPPFDEEGFRPSFGAIATMSRNLDEDDFSSPFSLGGRPPCRLPVEVCLVIGAPSSEDAPSPLGSGGTGGT